jgi:hypothetical protein
MPSICLPGAHRGQERENRSETLRTAEISAARQTACPAIRRGRDHPVTRPGLQTGSWVIGYHGRAVTAIPWKIGLVRQVQVE